MPASDIVIRGAREHNLQSVDVTIPRGKLVVMTGVSGSGKSSLAFDTLYAEGQRRYVESLSSYARQFLGQLPKPDVDLISGLAPSISIQQKTSSRNPRSTVGTITEVYDYLRVLFSRVGTGHCPNCDRKLTAQSLDQILESILRIEAGRSYLVLAPLITRQKGEYKDLFEDLLKQGFVRARVDGEVVRLDTDLSLDRQMRHSIEVVISKINSGKASRAQIAEAVELALKLGGGNVIVQEEQEQVAAGAEAAAVADRLYSADYACVHCNLSFDPPSPQLFSFNSPQGMCDDCQGLGRRHDFVLDLVIPTDTKSVSAGVIEPLGSLKKMGKWRRHIYQGVADAIEADLKLDKGTVLKTKWKDLPQTVRDKLLYGMGERHITYRWRHSGGLWKHGGTFEGVIAGLLDEYRTSRNPLRRRQLEKYLEFVECPTCAGKRLNRQARAVRVTSSDEEFVRDHDAASLSLPQVCGLSIAEAAQFFASLELDETQATIAEEALKEIRGRLGFLLRCGLDYLTLDRTAPTLSGGETQRIRLAGQIGCGLVGVVYILDEPSIGLHPRDNDRLLQSLEDLRDHGNTVIVVEHDEDTMRAADHLIDFGPGPGVRGGEVISTGSLSKLLKNKRSLTGQYLSRSKTIAVPEERRTPGKERITVKGATHNNLTGIDVEFPLGTFICVTGVSGSGKSSLVGDILWQVLNRDVNGGNGDPGAHVRVNGLSKVDKAIDIDQSPIGRTPRSNPATYVKLFDEIRSLYTLLPEAKLRGYKPGRFSFNVAEGRCEACEGHGSNKLEMDFLADVWVTCPVCRGDRFNHETLEIRYKGASIADVLNMDVQQALEHFENHPKIHRLLSTLHDVGLDYLKLGQPSPTLSGGEAQRIKLARELGKRSTGSTIYLLDEPTTGLHFADVHKLLDVLHGFVEQGNTVLVVEHNLDVIKTADHVIDLGPEGGAGGGRVIASGTPEEIAACEESWTGRALKPLLDPQSASQPVTPLKLSKASKSKRKGEREIVVRGAAQHNLQHIDLNIPRDKMSVFCGPSGSGKTSLAMDTLYAEGQRRYVESLSAYARQFLGQMPKPKVEHVHGLSPAIAIEQKTVGSTPRSTVGTVTEVYDYLRILFARLGQPHCPDCRIPIDTQTTDQVIGTLLTFDEGTRLLLLAPEEVPVGHSYDALWERLRSQGYRRVRLDQQTYTLDDVPDVDRRRKHTVEIVVDRLVVAEKNRSRIADSVENAFDLGRGQIAVAIVDEERPETEWEVLPLSLHFACQNCHRSFEQLGPNNYSFNSPLGWCESCEGLGTEKGRGREKGDRLTIPERSLLDGAIPAWPPLNTNVMFRGLIERIAKEHRFKLDVPFEDLSPKVQRLLLHGTGDAWYSVADPNKKSSIIAQAQYKGVLPAMEEAARVSTTHRQRLRDQMAEVNCTTCDGSRLRRDASATRLGGQTLHDVCSMPLVDAHRFLESLTLTDADRKIAGELLTEAVSRLRFLVDVGLHYLTLSRPLPTLSGGESQRIRLAGQIGRALTGVLYVLDEPTIGLHPRDNTRLIDALHRLRDLGNTLVLVEHDREVLDASDRLYDFGPGAGRRGGEVVGSGSPKQLGRSRTLTGKYLSDRESIPVPTNRRLPIGEPSPAPPGGGWLEVVGARHHNLQDVDLRIPLGTFVCVTGVSGSGKSSLIQETLARAVARKLSRTGEQPGPFDALVGIEHVNKQIVVDQQPLGNTPASNPATYTGVFDEIRELFARLPESKVRGYRPGRFSFNRSGGRCETCEGNGQICIAMHFLPDVWVECEVCHGQRYNKETLAVQYRGKSIADVLSMPIGEALGLFENVPKIRRVLAVLCAIGLDYLTLGQAAPTLSGGEAQRVKLASELARPSTGRTLYLLDEPTTGLHFDDIAKLLKVLNSLVEAGNTVVVIEHNLDVIKTADWLVDVGPEAGSGGGLIVAEGTPEDVVAYEQQRRSTDPKSETALALAPVLDSAKRAERDIFEMSDVTEKREGDVEIRHIGKSEKMPWEKDGRAWHTGPHLGHNGSPVRWETPALDRLIDRLEQDERFADVQWNHRSIVELSGTEKAAGWFLHAMTAEEWLLKLKFRVKRGTFKEVDLRAALKLKKLHDIDEIPVYHQAERVRVTNAKGPWQEVVVTVHWEKDIESKAFDAFLTKAVDAYFDRATEAKIDPESQMPWVKLGRKWHLSTKGFPPDKKVYFTPAMLESVFDKLDDLLGSPDVEWTNKQVVHFRPNSSSQPAVSVNTKRREGIDLILPTEPGTVTNGRILAFGHSREIRTSGDREQVRIRLRTKKQINDPELWSFVEEVVHA